MCDQINNHLGSASLELNENAAIISYEEYHLSEDEASAKSCFGTTSYQKHNTDISQKRYKYVGKERDDETGLYYYGARYYAAWIARFVSVDPLQHDYPIFTPYHYVENNPINKIDPDGREVINAHEDERNKKKDIRDQAKLEMVNAQKKAGSLTKADDDYKLAKKDFRKKRRAFNKAERKFNRIDELYTIVDKAIKELKQNDPLYFRYIDRMENPDGNKIKIFISATNQHSVDKTGGLGRMDVTLNEANRDPITGYIAPETNKYGLNTVSIKLSQNSGGKTLKHEFGHVEVSIKDVSSQSTLRTYMSYNPDKTNLPDMQDLGNPSKKRAIEAENSYDMDPGTSILDTFKHDSYLLFKILHLGKNGD